jgi:ribonuclease P protein component
LSFPKRKRLLSNEDFKAVLEQNQNATNGFITLYVAGNDFEYPRLGISVGKACGKAVLRNRLKRLLREVFRQNQHRIPQNLDYVVVVSSKAKLNKAQNPKEVVKKIRLNDLQDSFLRLVTKIIDRKS